LDIYILQGSEAT